MVSDTLNQCSSMVLSSPPTLKVSYSLHRYAGASSEPVTCHPQMICLTSMRSSHLYKYSCSLGDYGRHLAREASKPVRPTGWESSLRPSRWTSPLSIIKYIIDSLKTSNSTDSLNRSAPDLYSDRVESGFRWTISIVPTDNQLIQCR